MSPRWGQVRDSPDTILSAMSRQPSRRGHFLACAGLSVPTSVVQMILASLISVTTVFATSTLTDIPSLSPQQAEIDHAAC